MGADSFLGTRTRRKSSALSLAQQSERGARQSSVKLQVPSVQDRKELNPQAAFFNQI